MCENPSDINNLSLKIDHTDQPVIISTYIEYIPEITNIVTRPEHMFQLIEIIKLNLGYFLIPIIQWNYSSRMF